MTKKNLTQEIRNMEMAWPDLTTWLKVDHLTHRKCVAQCVLLWEIQSDAMCFCAATGHLRSGGQQRGLTVVEGEGESADLISPMGTSVHRWRSRHSEQHRTQLHQWITGLFYDLDFNHLIYKHMYWLGSDVRCFIWKIILLRVSCPAPPSSAALERTSIIIKMWGQTAANYTFFTCFCRKTENVPVNVPSPVPEGFQFYVFRCTNRCTRLCMFASVEMIAAVDIQHVGCVMGPGFNLKEDKLHLQHLCLQQTLHHFSPINWLFWSEQREIVRKQLPAAQQAHNAISRSAGGFRLLLFGHLLLDAPWLVGTMIISCAPSMTQLQKCISIFTSLFWKWNLIIQTAMLQIFFTFMSHVELLRL